MGVGIPHKELYMLHKIKKLMNKTVSEVGQAAVKKIFPREEVREAIKADIKKEVEEVVNDYRVEHSYKVNNVRDTYKQLKEDIKEITKTVKVPVKKKNVKAYDGVEFSEMVMTFTTDNVEINDAMMIIQECNRYIPEFIYNNRDFILAGGLNTADGVKMAMVTLQWIENNIGGKKNG